MKDGRDKRLAAALRRLEVPAHRDGFFETVWAAVDQDLAPSGIRRRRISPRQLRPRHLVLVAASALAVAAVVAVVLLGGLPGVSRITGPEPVSAAQVIHKMLVALSTGETLQAVSIEKSLIGVSSDGEKRYSVGRGVIALRSDGSYRYTQTGVETPRMPKTDERIDAEDIAYDAERGVLRHYMRGWYPQLGQHGKYLDRFEVTTDYPLGPPDAWPPVRGFDFSAVARAEQAVDAATVTAVSYEGRPAWVISISTRDTVDRWLAQDEVSLTTVDQQTCLPVRFQVLEDGVLVGEYRWVDVRVDEPLPDSLFAFPPPKGAEVVRRDGGFRRTEPTGIGSEAGVMVPGWLPAGYKLSAAEAARRATTANGVTTGSDVVALQYTRAFDTLRVTTRTVDDPRGAAEYDPVEQSEYWVGIVGRDVRLSRGAFAGATARLVLGPHISSPHLWVVKDRVMLTVAGSATAKELVAVAESVRRSRPAPPIPSP